MLLFLTIWITLLAVCETKANLRHSQSNKHFISQLDEGTFEIVHPFQVRDKKERIGIDTHNYFINATVHYKHVVIVIRSNTVAGVRLKLVLNLNENILLNETKFKRLDENGVGGLDHVVENCYYQGTVNGDSSSFVAISTCNGLWGIIAFENGTSLGIWPLDGGDKGRRHPHVLYKIKWTRDASCGAVTQTPSQVLPLTNALEQSSSLLKIKRDVSRQSKYLELAVIADHTYMKEFNLTEDEGIEFALLSINIADLVMSRDLKMHLSVVYMELWLDAQRVDLHNDIQQTLSGTVDYTTGHIYHVEKDASVLFTAGFFANSEMLSSTFSSVCTARAVGIVKAIDAYSVHTTAQFVTHVLGHVVGIDHDSSECTCQHHNLLPCNMNRQIGAIGSPFIWQFSKCSVARMQNLLQSEHVQCLLSRPFQTSRLYQCGNGVVDDEEECDCGRRDECFDPCCDPITCTLRAHAQCASHQPCCHRCELRQVGYVCRESRSICDVPEVCDGKEGDCPADGYLIDGVLCGINGQCWKGNCSDAEQQCKDLWGSAAKSAEDPCYSYNQKGVEYGNCGTDKNGAFVACTTDDNSKCGTLHCRDGSALPLLSTLTSFNLQFVHHTQQMQCKVITGSSHGLVKEGTSCASGKICIEGACIPLAQVSPSVHCPSNNLALQCSGHGDCTTTQKCLCYDGWAGSACDIRSNQSRRIGFATIPPVKDDLLLFPSFKVGKTLETSTLLGILLLVGIFLLLLLVCLLFCYRRKSSNSMHEDMMHEKIEDESLDVGNRAIKFGQMPSYREEKRKRKKNKRVYDALQRINEAAEERDSVSLKSKESSLVTPAAPAQHQQPVPNGNVGMMEGRPAGFSHKHSNDSIATDTARSGRHHHQQNHETSLAEYDHHHNHASGTSSSRFINLELNRGSNNSDGMYIGSSHTLSPTSLSHPLDMAYSSNPMDCLNGSSRRQQQPTSRKLHYLDRGGYATDSELPPMSRGIASNGILLQSDGMECPMTPPLRLQSIQHLLKRLNPEDKMMQNMGDCDDSDRGFSNYTTDQLSSSSPINPLSGRQTCFGGPPPEPPPASADSGHHTFGASASSGSPNYDGGTYDIRESPSLFSDAFKLDLSN